MDSPIFPNYYYAPASHYTTPYRPSPFTRQNTPTRPSPFTNQNTPTRRPAAKVVSVPVHFVQSQRLSSEAAAVRIQKVFRRFRVRKALGKIRAVWAEVAAMERRVDDAGLADGLKRDERERVRVNESLMVLLFRLDSVPGVDPAVRDCRKTAIRRVVALQERVDSLIENTADRDTDESVIMEEQPDQSIEETPDCDLNTDPIVEGLTDQRADDGRDSPISDSIMEDDSRHSPISDSTMEDEQSVEEEREMVDAEKFFSGEEEECVVNATQEARGGEGGLKEVMERMVEENMKLQRMITELCDREERQSRVMSSLSRRVEALEKAVAKKRKTKKDKSCNSRKGRCDLNFGNV